jgi:hypothetical protein
MPQAAAAMRESQSIIYLVPPGIATRIIGLLHEEFCPDLYGRSKRSHVLKHLGQRTADDGWPRHATAAL